MPTTLTSLLLFVVMLLPGFAYLVGKERGGTERHTSPFRETVAIVAASISSEVAVLILFAVVRTLGASWTPDVGALIRGGSAYLRGNYQEFAIWGAAMLLLSVVLAYAATVPCIRRRLPGTYPHDSTVSAWWLLFGRLPKGREVYVGCNLDDGSYLQGRLQSFNNSADDAADRELILGPPITYRPSKDDEEQAYPVSGVSIAARRVVSLFVSYAEQVIASSPGVEAGVEAPVLRAASASRASGPSPQASSVPSAPPSLSD